MWMLGIARTASSAPGRATMANLPLIPRLRRLKQVISASYRPARFTQQVPGQPGIHHVTLSLKKKKKKLLTDRTLAYHHKVQNSCQNTHTHTPTKMPILKEKNLEQVE